MVYNCFKERLNLRLEDIIYDRQVNFARKWNNKVAFALRRENINSRKEKLDKNR